MCRCSGALEQPLKEGLQKFSTARRYEYWSQYVKSLVCHVVELEEEGICYFTETQMLISAWRTLLILSTTHVCHSTDCRVEALMVLMSGKCIVFICILCFQSDVMHLMDDSTKLKLFMDVLDGTKAAVSPPNHDTVV